jgi:hypothetical protein
MYRITRFLFLPVSKRGGQETSRVTEPALKGFSRETAQRKLIDYVSDGQLILNPKVLGPLLISQQSNPFKLHEGDTSLMLRN